MVMSLKSAYYLLFTVLFPLTFRSRTPWSLPVLHPFIFSSHITSPSRVPFVSCVLFPLPFPYLHLNLLGIFPIVDFFLITSASRLFGSFPPNFVLIKTFLPLKSPPIPLSPPCCEIFFFPFPSPAVFLQPLCLFYPPNARLCLFRILPPPFLPQSTGLFPWFFHEDDWEPLNTTYSNEVQ